MLDRLQKLAARSAQLRNAAFSKQAGLLGSAASGVSRWATNNPGKALFGAMGVAGSAAEGKGKYKQFKTGFDPTVQKAMLGQAPNPPGM